MVIVTYATWFCRIVSYWFSFFFFVGSVIMFLSDMSGRKPLYRKYAFYILDISIFAISSLLQLIGFQACYILCSCRAFVFFSSPIARELVLEIKKDTLVLPRIGALREVKFCFCFLNI
jgi:syntaxin-binding protein 1